MDGKSKCKILKDIRARIAQENDIEYVTSECKFQGNCSGTCPKCEAEVRYLEQELQKRQALGKKIAVAGVAAALVVASAGCDLFDLSVAGKMPYEETTEADVLDGDISVPETDPMEITGPDLVVPGEVPYEHITMGDVAWPD